MSFIETRHHYHNSVRYWFKLWLAGQATPETTNELQKVLFEDENKQWAKMGYNIMDSKTDCPQKCRYCYVLAWKIRMDKDNFSLPSYEDIEDLGREEFVLDERRAKSNWTVRRKPRLYIFASTHDIFPEMVDAYIKKARNIIETGSEILIVTKPRIDCIKTICEALADYKDKLMLICTITSDKEEVLKYWEPFAPTYSERKDSLIYAFRKGFKTSVSMEPYLSDPRPVIKDLRDYVTHAIWLGRMNHCRQLEFEKEQYEKIDDLYSSEYIKQLIIDLWEDEKVYFKYSMMRTVGLTGKRRGKGEKKVLEVE
ncbi:MAG: radical SAM protein [bacterium]